MRVVGKSEPARIFSLIGDAAFARTDVFTKAQSLQSQMLDLYRVRQWEEALERLGQLDQLGLDRCKGYFSMMHGRIEEFKAHPPGEDWDGVERRLVK